MTKILFILGIFATIFVVCLPFFIIKAVVDTRKASTFEKKLKVIYQKLGISAESPLKVSSVNLNNAVCMSADSRDLIFIDLEKTPQTTRYSLAVIENAELKLNGTTRISVNQNLDQYSLNRLEKNIKQIEDGQVLELCVSLRNQGAINIPVYTSKTLGFDLKHQLLTAFVLVANISEIKSHQPALYTQKNVAEPA